MNQVLHIGAASDGEVAQKVLLGDTASFEILIRRYNPLLYKIARSYGFNHQDAEDLMQDTHFKAFTVLGQMKSNYKNWISRILINNCIYKLSYGSSKYERMASDLHENSTPLYSTNNNSADAANKELSKILENSLLQLPLTYRTVFVLREVEGFNVAETAELLGITEVNVKVRLSRAKVMLQNKLEHVYSSNELFEFNLVYCDGIVNNVFARINEYLNK